MEEEMSRCYQVASIQPKKFGSTWLGQPTVTADTVGSKQWFHSSSLHNIEVLRIEQDISDKITGGIIFSHTK